MANADAVNRWVWNACQRSALAPTGLGVQIYDAVESKLLTDEQAATLVRSFLSAGIDTTANALGLAIHLFATHPEQWQALRADPSLARAAFEEVMRFESPFQTFFRTTTRDTEIEGVPIAANEKVLLSIGAANRDPRRWESPEVFEIGRTTAGHVGFGAGIHGCVGQMMARLEVEIVLRALASKVKTIEIIGEPRRMLHNTLRGFASLPVRLHA
jgi:cytochrome P450